MALWSAWLIANLCIWMTDMAASWLMTSLTNSKFMVAMIQTAATLPVFLLALPAGTLADRMNRRQGFLIAQTWTVLVLVVMGVAVWTERLTPQVLLGLVFVSSLATVIRWPMFTALIPDVVPRERIPQAVSLNGIAVNASRLLGPVLAGFIVVAFGGGMVFALCAVLSLAAAGLVIGMGPHPADVPAAREPWLKAMYEGLVQARSNSRLRAILVRGFLFFMTTTSLLGLLPSLAKELSPGAGLYAALFACLGGGAVVAGFLVQPLRRGLGYQGIVTGGTAVMGLCVSGVATVDATWLAAALMLLAGAAWMGAGNTLNICAQLALTNEVRARGMSILLMSVMAGGSVGAACFGALADGLGLRPTLLALGGLTLVTALGMRGRLWIAESS